VSVVAGVADTAVEEVRMEDERITEERALEEDTGELVLTPDNITSYK